MPKASRRPEPVTSEDHFWRWVEDTTGGWLRYSPAVAKALGSHEAALVLSDAIHLSTRHSTSPWAAGGWFYMPMREWSARLAISQAKVERALSLVSVPVTVRQIHFTSERAGRGKVRRPALRCGLGLLQSVVANRLRGVPSPCTHYRVDYGRLQAWWTVAGFGQQEIRFPQNREIDMPKTPISISETELVDFLLTPIPISNWPTSTSAEAPRKGESQKPREDAPSSASAAAGAARMNDAAELTDLFDSFGIGEPVLSELVRDLAQCPREEISECVMRSFDRVAGGGAEIRDTAAYRVTMLRDLARRYVNATTEVPS